MLHARRINRAFAHPIAGWALTVLLWLSFSFALLAQSEEPVVVAIEQEITRIDPAGNPAGAAMLHGNVYEGLTQLEQSGRAVPALSVLWAANRDATAWTFILRRGVTFHDGTVLTAELAAQALNLARQNALSNASALAGIYNLRAIDDSTLEFTLTEPDGDFPAALAQVEASIFKPSSDGDTPPLGTGPYVYNGKRADGTVELIASDTYWAMPARLSPLHLKHYSDREQIFSDLMADRLHIAPNFKPLEWLVNFQVDPRFNVLARSSEREIILAMNHRFAAIKDRRLRKSIAHSIDRDALIEDVLYGYGVPIGSHFAPHHGAAVDLRRSSEYDPVLAKRLLQQSGKADTPLVFLIPDEGEARALSEHVIARLKKTGINVTGQVVDRAEWVRRVFIHADFQLSLVAFPGRQDITLYGNATNFMGFTHPDMPPIMDALRRTPASPARDELLRLAQEFLSQRVSAAYLAVSQNPTVVSARIKGIPLTSPVGTLPLGQAYYD